MWPIVPHLLVELLTRLDTARLIESGEYFGDASMRYEQLSTDIAWPDSHKCQFDNSLADVERKWPPVYKQATQLIYSRLSYKRDKCIARNGFKCM